jgi:hypothetical protein
MCHDGHNLSLGLKQKVQQTWKKGLEEGQDMTWPKHFPRWVGNVRKCKGETTKMFNIPNLKVESFLKSQDPLVKVWRIKSCLNKIQ